MTICFWFVATDSLCGLLFSVVYVDTGTVRVNKLVDLGLVSLSFSFEIVLR